MSAAAVAAANATKGALRAFSSGARGRAALSFAALSVVAFAVGETVAAGAVLRVSRIALAELPALRPDFLLERMLGGAFTAAGILLVLGSLTTAVSTLFLSEELPARIALPVPHHRIVARQLGITIALSSAPTLLLAGPLVLIGASAAPRPALAVAVAGSALVAVALLAGTLGASLAIVLVRVVPPQRARLLAAFLSALGLASALIGFRGARPERLMDPLEALEILSRLGATPPADPGWSPALVAARASTRALFGDASGVAPALVLLAAAAVFFGAAARALAPLHFRIWQLTREAPAPPVRAGRVRVARSLWRSLLAAEAATLFRDASTPAQLGSLAAVFVLHLLNLRLLPSTDPAARDLVAGLQTGLALFLVAALALRFAYPSVSSDGRAALVLRTLPLSPARHLAARYVVRGLPALFAALVLVGASLAALRPGPGASVAALAVAAAGGLALPGLNLGIGGLLPRYDAPNAVAVALGPGGIVALTLSTGLALSATVVVSEELRLLLATAVHLDPGRPLLLALWLAGAAMAAAIPIIFAAKSLQRADISAG